MRVHPLWRILLCILLVWQSSAGALSQSVMTQSMTQSQDVGRLADDEHVQMPCHGHEQADAGGSAEKPDCCKASHCQCHSVHTPGLSISLPVFVQSFAHSPIQLELATPRALTHTDDSFRPPI